MPVATRTVKNMLVFVFLSALLVCCDGLTVAGRNVEKYYCNGECDVERTRCSCMSTCKQNRNCCIDYVESCEGGLPWTEEECAAAEELICPEGYDNPKPLLLISLDGYRDIYLERNLTPTVDKIARCGVRVPYMISQYPTKTFPNHYSMVTGLYPESHGIIANKMYNHDVEEEFRPGRPAAFEPYWWRGEPIWVTARRQGLVTAAYFWPGSDVNITMYPNYWYKYDGSVDLEERVYQMLDWVDLPQKERPSLINMYTNVVDHPGHVYGPFGEETNDGLKTADHFVKMIMNGLRDRGLDKCFTVMVMSDHGMANLDCENKVRYVGDYGVNMSEVYTDLGPYARIGKSTDKSLWEKFDPIETKKKLECKQDETHWEAFLKYEYLPKRYHYANNPWIEDLHLVNDQEWWVAGDQTDGPGCTIGNHGFDNAYTDMRGIFFGHGPGLRREFERSRPVSNIELYNLYADLLEINPSPNNGTQGSLYDVMANSPGLAKEGTGLAPSSCPFPTDGSNAGDLGCDGCDGISNEAANERLNLNESEITEIEKKHLLYGSSRIFDSEASFCKLIQQDYINIYDKEMKLPRLVSFSVKKGQSMDPFSNCVRRDPRLSDAATKNCTYYNLDGDLTWDFLYPPGLSSDESKWDAALSSNMVPVYKSFVEVWNYMQNYAGSLGNLYNGVTVDIGPIFDFDYDGHADTMAIRQKNDEASFGAVPTHFFLVMTRCSKFSTDQTIENCAGDISKIEVLSFIIPNYKEAPCHKDDEPPEVWIPRALVRHVATVKDIELLTKISFFSNWVANDNASKKDHIAAIQLKLHLPLASSDWLQQFLSSVSPTDPPTETTTSGAALNNVSYLFMLLLSIHVVISWQ